MAKGRFKCGFESIFLIASIVFGFFIFIHGVWLLVGVIDLAKYLKNSSYSLPPKYWIYAIVVMLTGLVQTVLSIVALVKTWEFKCVMIFHSIIVCLCCVVIVLYFMTDDIIGKGTGDDRSTYTLLLCILDIIGIVVCIILKLKVFK